MWAGKGGSHLYNCRILFTPLDELIECKLGVFVTVHVSENFVHPLLSGDRMISARDYGECSKSHTFSGVSSSNGSLTIDPVIL